MYACQLRILYLLLLGLIELSVIGFYLLRFYFDIDKLNKSSHFLSLQQSHYEYQSMKQNGILTSFMDGLLDIVYQIEGVYDMKTGLLPAKGMDPLAESYIC